MSAHNRNRRTLQDNGNRADKEKHMAARRKRKRKVVQPTRAASDVLALNGVEEVVTSKIDLLEELCPTSPDELVSQDVIQFAVELDALQQRLKKAFDAFKQRVVAHRQNGGAFEEGTFSVEVRETERRTPRWKQLAFDHYAKLTDLRRRILGLKLNLLRTRLNEGSVGEADPTLAAFLDDLIGDLKQLQEEHSDAPLLDTKEYEEQVKAETEPKMSTSVKLKSKEPGDE